MTILWLVMIVAQVGEDLPPMPSTSPMEARTAIPGEIPSPDRVVGLAELEQIALRQNPTLVQAKVRIEQARGNADQEGRYPNPFMAWNSQSLGADGTMGNQGAFVQQQIVTGGKLRYNRARAEVDIEIARWGLREQEIRVINGVRLRYWQIVALQRLLEVGGEAARLAEGVVELTREKVESGHASEADLLFAENEAEKFRIDLDQLQDRYTNSWREFAANLGSPGMQPVRFEDTLERYRGSIDWDSTLAWLIAESPEVRVAELQVERARWGLRRQEAEPVPDLILRGGASHDLASDDTLGIVRVYVDLPLWDRNQGNIYAARHVISDVQHDVQRVRLSVEQRFSRRFNQYQTSLTNVRRFQEEIVPRARKVFELYAESFAEEDASYSRVQSGLTAYNDARGKLVLQLQELRNAETAIVGLLLVPEGGIEAGTPRPPGGVRPAGTDRRGSSGRRDADGGRKLMTRPGGKSRGDRRSVHRLARWVMPALAMLLMGGCAYRQLGLSTVLTANSFQTIVYQMVLNNLAMIAAEPEALPWHVRGRDGTVQISDTLGIGQQGGGFSSFEGGGLGVETYGPQGSRKVSLQWGTDAVGDPVQLYALQTAYRRALGYPNLPIPNFIDEAARSRANRPGSEDDRTAGDNDPETRSDLASMEIAFEGEVPMGWYFIGTKKEVPKDACHVGRYGDCYVWVMPEGVGGLTRFTLLILSIVKLDSTEGGERAGGLMFSP